MMGIGSIWHWLVVLLIVLLVFGTKRISQAGQDLGGAVRGFRAGFKELKGVQEDLDRDPLQ